MANYERGVYEPSDEVRVFDGAEDEDDAEGSRLPLVIVLALVVLAAFGGVVWMAYSEGVVRGRSETPVLAAAPGPERVAPQNPGGANVQYQGFKIYEQPAPPDDEGDIVPAATPPAPVQAAAPPPPKLVPIPAAAPKPTIAPPPAMKQTAAPKTGPAAPGVATGVPRQLPGTAAAPATVTPAKPDAPAAISAASANGGTVLQIGAYKSQEDADSAWKTYKARHAALLSGYGPDVRKADLGDKGTWYRLRIAGFADKDVAAALCDRLKADSGVCFLGK